MEPSYALLKSLAFMCVASAYVLEPVIEGGQISVGKHIASAAVQHEGIDTTRSYRRGSSPSKKNFGRAHTKDGQDP